VPIKTALPGWAIMCHSCWMPVLLGVEREVNAALGSTRFVFFVLPVGSAACTSRLEYWQLMGICQV
jgi:hypothetical protein